MAKAYITDSCCGASCGMVWDATDEEPCWGEIHAIDEEQTVGEDGEVDYYWVHACDGHNHNGSYYNSPPPGFLEKTPATPCYER